MAKGELKLILGVKTGALEQAIKEINRNVDLLNNKSDKAINEYNKILNNFSQKAAEVSNQIQSTFATPQKGGVWKQAIAEASKLELQAEQVGNAFKQITVEPLRQGIVALSRGFSELHSSSNKTLDAIKKDFQNLITSGVELEQQIKNAFVGKQSIGQYANSLKQANTMIEKFSENVEGKANLAISSLRQNILSVGKIAGKSLSTKEFQYFYRNITQASQGTKTLVLQFERLNKAGLISNDQMAFLSKRLSMLGTQAEEIKKLALASYSWGQALDGVITRLARVRTVTGGWVDTVTRTVYKLNFLTTQIGQQLHTLALYVGSVFISVGGLKIIDDFEKLDITLQKITGSMGEYTQSWDFIKNLAKETPQNIQDVTDSFVRLKAYGLDPTDGMLKTIYDTVSALGGDQRTMASIVRAFGQIQAKGKLMGQEIRQLADANIPVYTILNEQLGITGEQIDNIGNMGITASEALQGITTWLDKAFGGTSAQKMDTLTGRLSNLYDVLINTLYEISKSSGAVDYLKNKIVELTDVFEQFFGDGGTISSANERVRSFGYTLRKWMVGIVEGVTDGFKNAFQYLESAPILKPLISIFDGATKSVSDLSNAISTFIVFFVKMKLTIITFMSAGVVAGLINALVSLAEKFFLLSKALKSYIVSIKAAQIANYGLSGSFGFLTGSINKSIKALRLFLANPWVAAIVALAAGLYTASKYSEDFKKSINSLLSSVKVLFPYIKTVGLIVLKTLNTVFIGLGLTIDGLIVTLMNLYSSLKMVTQAILFDWSGAKKSYDAIIERTKKLNVMTERGLDEIKDMWRSVGEEIKNTTILTDGYERSSENMSNTINELNKATKNFKDIFGELAKLEPVQEELVMAEETGDYIFLQNFIEEMEKLKILKKDVSGELQLQINTQIYQDFKKLLQDGHSLNSALKTLEIQTRKTSEEIKNSIVYEESSEAISDMAEEGKKLEEQLSQIQIAASNFTSTLTTHFANGAIQAKYALERLDGALYILQKKMFDTGAEGDLLKKSLISLTEGILADKIKIYSSELSKLDDQMKKSQNAIKEYQNSFKEYSDKITSAINDINSVLIEKSPLAKQDYIGQLEKSYSDIDKEVFNLRESFYQLRHEYEMGLITTENFDQQARATLESLADALLKKKEIYQEYSSTAGEERVNQVLGDQIYTYEQLRDMLQQVKEYLTEINQSQVQREETALSKMQKESEDTKQKIQEIQDKISQLNKMKMDMIINDEQLDNVIKKINDIPDTKTIDIIANIKTNEIKRKLGGIVQGFSNGGLVQKLARGGFLGGYGGGDRIKALLEAGEFVMRKEAVKKFGLGFMQAINNLSFPTINPPVIEAPKVNFATGGSVQDFPNLGTLNLNIGGQTFPVLTEKDVADKLQSYLNRQKRVSL